MWPIDQLYVELGKKVNIKGRQIRTKLYAFKMMMTMRYLLLQFLSFTMMNGFMVQANVRWVVDFYLGHTNSFIFHYKINNEFMTCFQQFFPWIFLILNSWKRKETSDWSKKVFSQFIVCQLKKLWVKHKNPANIITRFRLFVS